MKTLILCVDRDDDLGRKAAVETPVVGRRRVMDAALALGLADPEDSDTNALLMALSMYDKELAREQEDRQMEVAAVAGHASVGLRSDRELAREIDQVLEVVQPDDVILVSDGAEDEQILPILQSRTQVAHVKRSIVKQAPRLEGFLYTMGRLFEDDKVAKRFLLPLALVFAVWSLAAFFDLIAIAIGLTLAIIGAWLFIHAMHWEDRMERFFHDFAAGLRRGRVTLVATVVMAAILVVGAVQAVELLPTHRTAWYQTMHFLDTFMFYFVSALLVRTAGRLFDELFAEGRASLAHWTFAFTLIAFGFIAGVIVDLAMAVMDGATVGGALTFDLVVRLLVGFAVMASGIVLSRYVKSFFKDETVAD